MKRPEEALQRQVVQYLHAACPDLLFWATPNQKGTRSGFEMGVLKAMGGRAGVPDIAMVLPNGRAAFIELKAKGGRLSPAQEDFCVRCSQTGAAYYVCFSVEDVEVALADLGIPTRGRVAA